MLKRLFIFIFLLSLLITSCSKKQTYETKGPKCKGDSYFTSEIKKLMLKAGSYWVYYDSIANVIDSTYIYSAAGALNQSTTDCPDTHIDSYGYTTYSSIAGDPQYYNLLGGRLVYSNSTNFYYDPLNRPSNYSLDIYCDYNSCSVSDYGAVNNYSQNLSVVKRDSAFIYDRYYKNVDVFTCTSDPRFYNQKTIYYTNADFGILKKEIFNSSNVATSRKVLIRKLILR
jgi:hypothetical protein